jgi:TPR repeat protein
VSSNTRSFCRLGVSAVLAFALALPLAASAGPDEDYQAGFDAYRKRGDIVGAMPPLRRAAAAGHIEAQLLLGYILDWSEENEEAVRIYRLAAEAGDPRGQLELGRMYLAGEGVERDPMAARNWFEMANAQGHVPATIQIAYAYLNGAMGYPQDYAQARVLFRQALDAGFKQAQTGLDALERAEAAARAAADRAAAAKAEAGTAAPQQAKP